jgi:hypothetical protein
MNALMQFVQLRMVNMSDTTERTVQLARQAGAETQDGIHWEFDDFDPILFAKLVREETLTDIRASAVA